MRTPPIVCLACFLAAAPAAAQEQQAGNAASANAEETFQKLVAQCDDTDALILRSRIRLLLGRTTAAAAAEAQTLMDEGLAKCGDGDLPGAMATLQTSYDVANAGATEKFGQDGTAEVAAKPEPAAAPAEKADKPWWKVW